MKGKTLQSAPKYEINETEPLFAAGAPFLFRFLVAHYEQQQQQQQRRKEAAKEKKSQRKMLNEHEERKAQKKEAKHKLRAAKNVASKANSTRKNYLLQIPSAT